MHLPHVKIFISNTWWKQNFIYSIYLFFLEKLQTFIHIFEHMNSHSPLTWLWLKQKKFDSLRNLVPLVQFKKREKHPCRRDTFSRAAGWSLQLYRKYHSSMGVFHVFFNCANDPNSPKASQIIIYQCKTLDTMIFSKINTKLKLQY